MGLLYQGLGGDSLSFMIVLGYEKCNSDVSLDDEINTKSELYYVYAMI